MSAQTQAHFAYRAPHPPSPYRAVASPSYQHHPRSSHHHHYNHNRQPTNNHHPTYTTYMNPTFPQPAAQTTFQTSARHGIKRSAVDPDPEDELERSSHISTQFKKLRLNNQHQQQHNSHDSSPIFDPYNTQNHQQHHHIPPSTSTHDTITTTQSNPQPQLNPTNPPTLPSQDFMPIDETPHKIYISDLSREIATIEASERSSSQIFLPDFEKQIGAIPDHVLHSNAGMRRAEVAERSHANNHNHNQALVLYKDPVSISVPEEEDAVRKAILEARRGIRERMRRDQQRERETAFVRLGRGDFSGLGRSVPGPSVGDSNRYSRGEEVMHDHDEMLEDGDAMDIE